MDKTEISGYVPIGNRDDIIPPEVLKAALDDFKKRPITFFYHDWSDIQRGSTGKYN